MLNLPYKNYQQATKLLADIQPIDYYLAENLSMHFERDDSDLFHCFLLLSQAVQQGHTCLPLEEIPEHIGFAYDEEGTKTHNGYNFEALNQLSETLTSLGINACDDNLIVLSDNCLYLRRYFNFETELANRLKLSLKPTELYDVNSLIKQVNGLFPDNTEIDWQKLAVLNALKSNFSIIAGGPGTGKTYTVTKLLAAKIALHKEVGSVPLKIALVAPTGKAAQRLSESISASVDGFSGQISDEILSQIPLEARTIHRLLGYIPNSVNFKHNERNLLDVDFILVDEASMVDLPLMTRLLRALPDDAQLVLLGDADQLPAVDVGNVLAELAPRPHPGYSTSRHELFGLAKIPNQGINEASGYDHLTFLLKSRRFDGEGGIGLIAKAVINSEIDSSWQLLNSNVPQLNFQQTADDNYLLAMVKQYYLPIFSAENLNHAFELLSKFRILVATRVGPIGVEAINARILDWLIGAAGVGKSEGIFHGLPIMITENKPEVGVYNGDIGIVWQDDEHLYVFFESSSGFTKVIPSRLPKFEPVFSMTIHKTQGSEFNHVLMLLPEKDPRKILNRELLYTGITRAKSELSIVSNENVWREAVAHKVKRFSNLSKHIASE